MTMPRVVVLGPSAGPRHDSFVRACADRLGQPPAGIAWHEFLERPALLAAALRQGGYLRIDTPDQDVAAIAALYHAGEAAAAAAGIATLPAGREMELADGAIGSPGQLGLGLVEAVARAVAIARSCGAIVSTAPEDVACAFDKRATLARLRGAGLPVPRTLPPPAGFDALAAAMDAARLNRVFVKLRHGSAAAGMIALARNGGDWRAVTTAEQGAGGELRATRDVRHLRDRAEIAALVDRLAPLGLHAEEWLPKIGIGGRVADVRLVMIEGGPVYPVLRTSRHPMTNLHLGGARAPVDALVRRIGDAAWEGVLASARGAARCFPHSHVIGLDIAILANGRSHALLEANIFGDFLKGVTNGGRCTHAAQAERIAERLAAPVPAAA